MEGSYVTITLEGTASTAKSGECGAEGRVRQQRAPLPRFEGDGGPFRTVSGVWVIDRQPTGRCLRGSAGETADQITNDRRRFVPYPIKNKTWKDW
jgi:glutathionylspermidine synthase